MTSGTDWMVGDACMDKSRYFSDLINLNASIGYITVTRPVNSTILVNMSFRNFLAAGSALLAIVLVTPAQTRVMLAGGHLPVCTSMSDSQCSGSPNWAEDALDGHRYRIDTDGLRRWTEAVEASDDQRLAREWLHLLVHLRDDTGPWRERGDLTRQIRDARLRFPNEPDRVDILGESLYQRADDRQWMRLLDHFQQPVEERREQVMLEASLNGDAVAVFKHFVSMAAAVSDRKRPLIAVSTASSRDPYDALDFYLQVFEQAGAEVIWLPLDAAVRYARQNSDCGRLATYQASELGSHDRYRVWHEHFKQQLEFCRDSDAGLEILDQIDGLFLNGGDQWLTLHAFRNAAGKPTPELERLLARLKADELVLGGTSAGAAVQAGPNMISNGGNREALTSAASASPPPPPGCQRSRRCPEGLSGDSLTYHPPGGLGSIPFAIVDTHFSERQRQLRLMRLLTDSDQRFGIGVDETTALVISPVAEARFRLEVIGAEAAWLFDRTVSDRALVHRMASGAVWTVDFNQSSPIELEEVTTELPCRAFDWSRSFNELIAGRNEPGIWRWCLDPAPDQAFELTLRALPGSKASVTTFDFQLGAGR